MNHFDLIIIGSGPGGYKTAEYAAKKGLQVAIIEEGEAGGTCLNRGCIPTKSLCHDAAGQERSFAEAMQRKQAVVEQLRAGVETLMSRPGITFIHGKASLTSHDAVSITQAENHEIESIEVPVPVIKPVGHIHELAHFLVCLVVHWLRVLVSSVSGV